MSQRLQELVHLPVKPAVEKVLDLEKLSSYSLNMSRRRAGTILPLEFEILEAGLDLQAKNEHVYGFSLARAMSRSHSTRGLTAHGTLYKALNRMVEAGLLESSWENPEHAEAENRPRRRLYRVTGAGAQICQANHTAVKGATFIPGSSLGPVVS